MAITRRDAFKSTGAMAVPGIFSTAAGEDDLEANAPGFEEPICLADYEPLARAKMSSTAWEYVNAGAADGLTERWNREAYQKIKLKPRVLVDAAGLDARVTLFGQEHAFPILLAPTSSQTLTHPEGELATARGAGAVGAGMVLSCFSSTSLEDVAAVATGPLWFQLYAQKDHGFTKDLVQRVEAGGYKALCLTVDTPITGARNRETRANVTLPELPNMTGFKGVSTGMRTGALDIFHSVLDASLTWQDVEWLCSFAKIPVLVKGVLDPDDAEIALKSGVAGVMVSNHGGRNLDTVPATIDALPYVTDRVAGRVPVLVDGGIRRGTDVLKAIAFGASAVLIGRPYVFGLGAAGAAGVEGVVRILQREFSMAMVLSGRMTVESIDRSVIWD